MRAFFVFCLFAVLPLHAAQPDAAAMIRGIRLSATLQQCDLSGVIRKDGQPPMPLQFFVREQNMQFRLGSGERFHVRLGDEKCELLSLDDAGKTAVFPDSRLRKSVGGSDLTYEDLTLRFLYWPGARLEGEEKIDGEDCYRIRLDNPGREGAFGVVYVWVHKKYGAFWRIKAHDRKGMPIKQFQVSKVMQLPGGKGYTIQTMRISRLDDQGRVESITYLEFDKPKIAGPKGPRR
ncbi:MAG: outer membrane lipoprotein-sorting protein [Verrucomicrobia bacterium]|nr:MAG: outer membrane lipoprotein-sorting protein [Verrucomicrobiota bacterium]TAE87238.1 MAG: outer membrane lipoprotein-sorting protein [Verrucomicrobiota bacterium]TAF25074.1 MAG: outer membrane lipoprotein-sorting protein [Verrucomicrobiota bacterium]